MRQRIALLPLFVAALALTAPSLASAHRTRHHRHAHAAHHRRLHARRHHRRPSSSKLGPPAPSTPSTPNTPPPSKSSATTESAGTIASFSNGVLTITLKDGSTVSGTVTESTRVCQIQPPPSSPMTADSSPTGPGADMDHAPGGWSQGRWSGPDGASGWGRQGEMGHPHCCGPAPTLTAGAIVQVAELRIGGAGAEWELVILAAS
jgi:hypothetical protein